MQIQLSISCVWHSLALFGWVQHYKTSRHSILLCKMKSKKKLPGNLKLIRIVLEMARSRLLSNNFNPDLLEFFVFTGTTASYVFSCLKYFPLQKTPCHCMEHGTPSDVRMFKEIYFLKFNVPDEFCYHKGNRQVVF